MRYKRFERAGVDVSEMSVGSWALGGVNYGAIDEKEAINAIHTMVELGVNMIDTAPIYGNGASEVLVGKALKGIRDKVMLTTKFGTYYSSYNKEEVIYDGRYDSVLAFCDYSLRRLDVDYFDFYLMHWPDPKTPIEESMAAMQELKNQGKIRFIGVSNYSREQIEEAEKWVQIDVIQPPFSMVNQSAKALMEWAAGRGIASMTYGSLGAGILTGTVRQKPDWDKNDTRLTFYDYYVEPKFSKVMELLGTLDAIAAAHDTTVAQTAINWTTQKDFVGTALVGVRNPDEAKENCAAFGWTLTPEEMTRIDETLTRLQIG